ncbi:unnamed protein product, partial [Pleuronectes platessa]
RFDRPEEEPDVVPLATEMVGGRLRCLSCFFTHSELLLHLLLLGVCLHDVEASGCDRTVHKQVGDTVEFPSCSSPEVNNKQVDTVTIRLHVQEPSTPPDISFNSTFHPSNGSCTVWLECLSTPDSNVNYSWSVRNQTLVGPRLRYTIRPQDGGTNFTCTISSSESSTSETVTCVNSSSDSVEEKHKLFFFAGLAAGGVLIVGLVAVIVVCHCKQRPADQDSTDLTVYADITEAAEESNVPRTSMKCSVYETVGDPVNAVKPGPHTVYDKIQLGRMKAAPVSLYQDVQGIRQ